MEEPANTPCACETCGAALEDDHADRCNACWEVERRLKNYALSENGRRYMRETLQAYADRFRTPKPPPF